MVHPALDTYLAPREAPSDNWLHYVCCLQFLGDCGGTTDDNHNNSHQPYRPQRHAASNRGLKEPKHGDRPPPRNPSLNETARLSSRKEEKEDKDKEKQEDEKDEGVALGCNSETRKVSVERLTADENV